MIHADIRGKLNPASTSRSEDVLTSTVLGLLRYVPDLLKRFIASARAVSLTGDELTVGESGTGVVIGDDIDVIFWQRLGRHGEIDAVVVQGDLSRPVRVVGLKAKFESDKSDAQRTAAPGELSDQLDEYWCGLREHAFSGPTRIGIPQLRDVQLVYLTAHLSAPIDPLSASLRALRKRGVEARLAWLSWRDAYRLLDGPFSRRDDRIVADLRTLLERKGLVPFIGIASLHAPELPRSSRFFSVGGGRYWAACVPPGVLPSPRFWRPRA